MEEIEDDPSVQNPLIVRYKHMVMGTPCKIMHGTVLLMTVMLLLATVADRNNIHTPWYHFLEFSVMLLFLGEVVASIYVLSPKVYFRDFYNQAETCICILCSVNYLAVIFHVLSESNEKEEHEAILALRYLAQLLRLSMFVRVAYAESKISSKPMDIRPQLFRKDDSDDDDAAAVMINHHHQQEQRHHHFLLESGGSTPTTTTPPASSVYNQQPSFTSSLCSSHSVAAVVVRA